MRTLYIDCFSGLAGDMLLGALFDLAAQLGEADRVNPAQLERELESLNLPEWHIEVERRLKQGIAGLGVRVVTPWGVEHVEDHSEHSHAHSHEHSHEHSHGLELVQILDLIKGSGLDHDVITKASKVFNLLGLAEARAHHVPIDRVHFHEVGMVDSIVDIVGVAWCLNQLRVTRVLSAPPPLNRGWVKCAHGVMPLPAPATGHLLEGIPTEASPLRVELVTPTGAAIIKALADEVTSSWPHPPVLATGWGAGTRDLPDRPNLVRVTCHAEETLQHEEVLNCVLLETNLDDHTPEMLAAACQVFLQEGALDVWQQPIMMKKGRVGVLLSVLCPLDQRARFERFILEHTSTLGVRGTEVRRTVLARRRLWVSSPWGDCPVKVSRSTDLSARQNTRAHWKLKPEYDVIIKLAQESQGARDEISRWVIQRAYEILASGEVTWSDLEIMGGEQS